MITVMRRSRMINCGKQRVLLLLMRIADSRPRPVVYKIGTPFFMMAVASRDVPNQNQSYVKRPPITILVESGDDFDHFFV